ncbi:MAG: hypothetical protein KDA32_02210 [Phycisphaerales bacterium]|nr:hypothetical protein [Phycisphaerales bacterium]
MSSQPEHRAAPRRTEARQVDDARIAENEPQRPAAPARHEEEDEGPYHYREISDFFNIREAYANVDEGEWEFEAWFEWDTGAGGDDNFGPILSLKYGFTDTFLIELEVEQLNFGDGSDQGNGELEVILFKEWWDEQDALPAFATWGEVRLPTGEGSSGIDADLHFTFTKQLAPGWRGHLDGYIETANGARGGEDADERRDFQWGVGPGIDYSFTEDTIGTMNYILRSGEEEGTRDENILEFGAAHRIAENQYVKFAFDINLDHASEAPNFGAKLLWSIEW